MCASMGNRIRQERSEGYMSACLCVCVLVGVLCYLRKCCKGPETCSINDVINEAPNKEGEGSNRKAQQ